MFEFLNDLFNYESRKVEKTEVNGVEVSTAYTSDEGYETAILDENGTYPVERYFDLADAEKGHWKWCEEAKTAETIVMLGGFEGLIPGSVVKLKRKI